MGGTVGRSGREGVQIASWRRVDGGVIGVGEKWDQTLTRQALRQLLSLRALPFQPAFEEKLQKSQT